MRMNLSKVDLETGKSEMLVSPHEPVEGEKSLIFNAVSVSKDGSIYYTVSSTRHQLYEGMLDLLEHSSPTGRVLK